MPVAYLHSLAALLPHRSSLTMVRCSTDATDPGLTTPEMPRRIELFLDQIEHMVKHVGEDGVGLGSAFDGAKMPCRLGSAAKLQNLVNRDAGPWVR
jgi:microsomal dipeptidase-like Zn-dependent dipeptidase